MSDEISSAIAEWTGGLIALPEHHIGSIEHKLGYFGEAPYVVFGYCARGAEVIWRDGHSSGFGTGGWRVFLEEVAPAALRCGVDLGSDGTAGTHVLLLDRRNHAVYAATRESAEAFLCRYYGLPLPKRQCLCGRIDCAPNATQTCIHPPA